MCFWHVLKSLLNTLKNIGHTLQDGGIINNNHTNNFGTYNVTAFGYLHIQFDRSDE